MPNKLVLKRWKAFVAAASRSIPEEKVPPEIWNALGAISEWLEPSVTYDEDGVINVPGFYEPNL